MGPKLEAGTNSPDEEKRTLATVGPSVYACQHVAKRTPLEASRSTSRMWAAIDRRNLASEVRTDCAPGGPCSYRYHVLTLTWNGQPQTLPA